MEFKLPPLLLIKLLENMAQMWINGMLPDIASYNYPNFPNRAPGSSEQRQPLSQQRNKAEFGHSTGRQTPEWRE